VPSWARKDDGARLALDFALDDRFAPLCFPADLAQLGAGDVTALEGHVGDSVFFGRAIALVVRPGKLRRWLRDCSLFPQLLGACPPGRARRRSSVRPAGGRARATRDPPPLRGRATPLRALVRGAENGLRIR